MSQNLRLLQTWHSIVSTLFIILIFVVHELTKNRTEIKNQQIHISENRKYNMEICALFADKEEIYKVNDEHIKISKLKRSLQQIF